MRHTFALIAITVLGAGTLSLAADGPFHLDSDAFPIGMFSVDNPGGMAQVAKMGVGYIHTYAGGRSTDEAEIARDRTYLDEAHKLGLKVMYNLHTQSWMKQPDGLAQVLKLVNAFKAHPALGFWYLYDEPDGSVTVEQLKPYYEAIRQATPGIPIAVCNAWSKHWYGYQDVLDILMTDIYPVTGLPFPEAKLDHVTKFAGAAVRLGKPVMPINQCFNWRAMAGQNETFRGSPVAQLRYPIEAELRYWCYAGLCQGVRGMFWWSYARSVQCGYGWINGEFAATMREFAEFTKLVAPAHQPVTFERAQDDDIFLAMWQRPGGTYLVMVNAWPLERPLSRGLEDKLQAGTLTPVGHTRAADAKLEGGRLTVDKALPWEAFVWKLEAR